MFVLRTKKVSDVFDNRFNVANLILNQYVQSPFVNILLSFVPRAWGDNICDTVYRQTFYMERDIQRCKTKMYTFD